MDILMQIGIVLLWGIGALMIVVFALIVWAFAEHCWRDYLSDRVREDRW